MAPCDFFLRLRKDQWFFRHFYTYIYILLQHLHSTSKARNESETVSNTPILDPYEALAAPNPIFAQPAARPVTKNRHACTRAVKYKSRPAKKLGAPACGARGRSAHVYPRQRRGRRRAGIEEGGGAASRRVALRIPARARVGGPLGAGPRPGRPVSIMRSAPRRRRAPL